MSPVLLTCLFSTFAMTGIIWFVQIVHYPLMAAVGRELFAEYEAAHCRRITPIVLPLMFAELITSLLLAARPMLQMSLDQQSVLLLTGLAMVAMIWGSTFLLQVPMHQRLEKGFDEQAWRILVKSNWIRTVLWTGRSAIMLSLVS